MGDVTNVADLPVLAPAITSSESTPWRKEGVDDASTELEPGQL